MKLHCLAIVLLGFISHVARAEYPKAYEEHYQNLVDYVGEQVQSSTNETEVSVGKLLLQGIEDDELTEDLLREYMRGESGLSYSAISLAALEWFKKTDYDLKSLETLLESSSILDQAMGFFVLRFVEPSSDKLQILRKKLSELISSKIMSGESASGFILHEIGACYASFIVVDNPIREKVGQEIRQISCDQSFFFGILNEMCLVLDYDGTCIDVETRLLINGALRQVSSASLVDDFLNKLVKDKKTKILSTHILNDIKKKSEDMIKVAELHINDIGILKDGDSILSRGKVEK